MKQLFNVIMDQLKVPLDILLEPQMIADRYSGMVLKGHRVPLIGGVSRCPFE